MRYFLILVIVGLCHFSFAQRQGVRKDLAVADAYFAKSEYANASKYFIKAFNKTGSAKTAQKVAQCYEGQRLFVEAFDWRKQVFVKTKDLSSFNEYVWAMVRVGKYSRAKAYIEKGKLKYGVHEDFEHIIVICDSSRKWIKKSSGASIQNLKKINTEFSEIAPTLNDDHLVYCSAREDVVIRPKQGRTAEPFYDLYKSKLKEEGKYAKPKSFSPVINSAHHEGSCAFADSGRTIYFTRVKRSLKGNKVGTGKNSLKLYKSTKNDLGVWSSPLIFRMDDTVSSFGHPTISQDGGMFFFVSDMPGGYGGKDIYVCVKLDTLWSDPINLGPTVNTEKDEVYPFLDGDERLVFASNGHLGMGGFDLFESKAVNGEFTSVHNMRPPYNSSFDDFSYFTGEGRTFFASNRPGGWGKEDIYEVTKGK